MKGPFTLADARRAGLERWHLEGSNWRRIGPTVYVWAGIRDSPQIKVDAAQRRLPPTAVFSGLTAAWLHGLDVASEPIEVTIPKGVGVSARSGIAVRRAALGRGDVVNVRGVRATSMPRTLSDICVRLIVTEAVVIADMALHAGLATLADLDELCVTRGGHAGVGKLRKVADLADAASESPMETRLRVLLELKGLPRPQSQVSIHDSLGRFVGRPDLYYPSHRLGLEYDGGVHRDSLADDNRRQNRLLGAGIRLLRFTAGDIFNHPDLVEAQVRNILDSPRVPGAAGLPAARSPREHALADSGSARFQLR
jgi:very-short-patch-repair endonuclease